jgi:hypothetical protein
MYVLQLAEDNKARAQWRYVGSNYIHVVASSPDDRQLLNLFAGLNHACPPVHTRSASLNLYAGLSLGTRWAAHREPSCTALGELPRLVRCCPSPRARSTCSNSRPVAMDGHGSEGAAAYTSTPVPVHRTPVGGAGPAPGALSLYVICMRWPSTALVRRAPYVKLSGLHLYAAPGCSCTSMGHPVHQASH